MNKNKLVECSSDSQNTIAFFLPAVNVGGAQRVMLNLMSGFIKLGYNSHLILGNAEGGFLSQIPGEAKVIDLKKERVLQCIHPMANYLNTESPDVLISAMTHVNDIAILANIISRSETKLVVTEHASRPQINTLFRIPIRRDMALARYLYKYSDKVVAASDGVADDVASWSKIQKRDIKTIYNPVVSDELIKMSKKSVSHKWFSEDTSTVIGVGRLADYKGFDTLIQAFKRVLYKKDARLVILGDGPEKENLITKTEELGISRKVDFLGFVDNPYKYMREADVFVLSSRHEGFGMVLVEAMACGTSVVATDCISGPSEILRSGEYGELVPVEDHNEMAQAILRSFHSPSDDKLLRERAHEFSVESITREYIDLID